MKKILTFVLILLLFVLSGCSQKNSIDPSSVPKKEKAVMEKDIEKAPRKDSKQPTPEEVLKKTPKPTDDEIVVVTDYIPDILVDLKYATNDNFTGKVIYSDNIARLRYGTVKKLAKVQEKLREKDMLLVILDAYRPIEAQFRLWEICPDPAFVANPNKGFSSHSRGNTIDITIANKDGKQITMPSEFDEFNSKADRNYTDVSQEAGANSQMLEDIMKECGFSGYSAEWWHYSDTKEYPVAE